MEMNRKVTMMTGFVLWLAAAGMKMETLPQCLLQVPQQVSLLQSEHVSPPQHHNTTKFISLSKYFKRLQSVCNNNAVTH